MRNRLIAVSIMLLVCGIISAWEIEDINGTWVYCEEHLKSPLRIRTNYYWGRGVKIVETSINIDLEPKTVFMPGMGMYIIDTVSKDDGGAICVKMFSIEAGRQDIPQNLKITFIDYKKAYIICSSPNGWWDKTLSPEENWVWYRLSGPPQKSAPTPPAN